MLQPLWKTAMTPPGARNTEMPCDPALHSQMCTFSKPRTGTALERWTPQRLGRGPPTRPSAGEEKPWCLRMQEGRSDIKRGKVPPTRGRALSMSVQESQTQKSTRWTILIHEEPRTGKDTETRWRWPGRGLGRGRESLGGNCLKGKGSYSGAVEMFPDGVAHATELSALKWLISPQ